MKFAEANVQQQPQQQQPYLNCSSGSIDKVLVCVPLSRLAMVIAIDGIAQHFFVFIAQTVFPANFNCHPHRARVRVTVTASFFRECQPIAAIYIPILLRSWLIDHPGTYCANVPIYIECVTRLKSLLEKERSKRERESQDDHYRLGNCLVSNRYTWVTPALASAAEERVLERASAQRISICISRTSKYVMLITRLFNGLCNRIRSVLIFSWYNSRRV